MIGSVEPPVRRTKCEAIGHATGSADVPDAARACEALIAHALALDAIFSKLAGLASRSMADWPAASARYARLALRAQSRCRATIAEILQLQRARRRDAEAPV